MQLHQSNRMNVKQAARHVQSSHFAMMYLSTKWLSIQESSGIAVAEFVMKLSNCVPLITWVVPVITSTSIVIIITGSLSSLGRYDFRLRCMLCRIEYLESCTLKGVIKRTCSILYLEWVNLWRYQSHGYNTGFVHGCIWWRYVDRVSILGANKAV